MNKLFNKIAALSVGLAMAIGVGVAVASNSKEVTTVHAATGTVTFNVTGWNGNTTGTSYISSETSGKDTSSTYSATMKNYIPKNGQVKGNQTSVGSNWYMFNTTAIPAPITKVEFSNGAGTLQNHLYAVFGTSSQGGVTSLTNAISASVSNSKFTFEPSASNNYTFFKLLSNEKFGSGNVTGCSVVVTYGTSTTALTSIGLSGTGVSSNAISIGSSDSTAHTINVSLTPSTATDQKVNIAHQSGTSGLFTKSASQITCSSGSGSFTITGTNATSGSETFRISGNTETSVYVDLVVTAQDDSVTYWTVSFDSDGGDTIADMSIEDGDTFEFPSPGTKEHYTFDGWTADVEHFYDAGDTSPAVTGDIEYIASWTEDSKYTVTYVHGDHGTGDNYVVNNVYGGSYTLVSFATAGFEASSGYAFKKWSVGGVEFAEGASITISGATTVTAVYEEVTTYTIVTDASKLTNGTTFVLVGYISSTYYVSNGLNSGHVLLTAKTSATTISNGVESGSTLVSTEAQVLTLEGSAGSFKIKYGDSYLKFTGNGNGNDSFDTEDNASTFSASMSGSYILFTCTSTTGSGRVWRLNTGSKDMRNYATSSGVGDVYMFAKIAQSNDRTVSFNSDGGSSIDNIIVTSGETFEFPSPGTKDHNTFLGWSSDGGTTKYATGATSPAVTEDIEYTAYWQEDAKYTVTYNAGANGTGSFADAESYGGTYTLLAFSEIKGENKVNPDSGYVFSSYTVGGETKNPGETFTLNANTTVTVNFEEGSEPVEQSVTFTAGTDTGETSVTKSGVTISTSTMSRDDNYRVYASSSIVIECSLGNITKIEFTGVSGNPASNLSIAEGSTGNYSTSGNDGTWTGESASVTFNSSSQTRLTQIKVTFEQGESYTITYYKNAEDATGSMSPSVGPSPAVAACEFERDGYTFARWNTQVDGEGDDYAVNTVVSEDVTLYAIWQEKIQPIGTNVTMDTGDNASAVTVNEHPAIKCGTGSKKGSMTLTLNQAGITHIKFYVAAWSSDTTNKTVNVSIDSGSISTESLTLKNDGNISGSTNEFTLAGEETDYRVDLTLTNAPQGAVITLQANVASNNRFVVWGATDLFAETFASEFMTKMTCNNSGTSAPSFAEGYSWSKFESIYNGLDAEEQGILQDAQANKTGTQIEQAMARYDYVEGKYNPTNNPLSAWKNFIGRTVTPIGSSRIVLSVFGGNNANSAAIIVIVSVVGVAAIGGYFFLRRRKED